MYNNNLNLYTVLCQLSINTIGGGGAAGERKETEENGPKVKLPGAMLKKPQFTMEMVTNHHQQQSLCHVEMLPFARLPQRNST